MKGNEPVELKRERLISILNRSDSLLVAFSGGVDSAFLLAVAHKVLKKNVVAITAVSPIHPAQEKEAALKFTKNLGIKQVVLQSREINQPDFVANRKDRCYICKKNLFGDLLKIASDMKIKGVVHGANVDDTEDFRPGFAAAYEMGIAAPMVKAGLVKDDIRLLSKKMNLETWNRPSMSCLATRIPYGFPITEKALKMVEQAENVILSLGFVTCRVKHYGNAAKIEIDGMDIERFSNKRIGRIIVEKLREIGFSRIEVIKRYYAVNRESKHIPHSLLRH